MNNQFATQFLLQEDEFSSLEDHLFDLGADEDLIRKFMKAIRLGILSPEQAINIIKSTLNVNEDGGAAVVVVVVLVVVVVVLVVVVVVGLKSSITELVQGELIDVKRIQVVLSSTVQKPKEPTPGKNKLVQSIDCEYVIQSVEYCTLYAGPLKLLYSVSVIFLISVAILQLYPIQCFFIPYIITTI